jgi:hypothetical protein
MDAVTPGAFVVINPATVAPGEEVTVTGAGFAPGSSVLLEVDGLYVAGAEATKIAVSPEDIAVSDSGRFQYAATLPSRATEGMKTLRAKDSEGTVAVIPLIVKK